MAIRHVAPHRVAPPFRLLLALLSVGLGGEVAMAQTSWTGTTSTAWGTAGNWTNGVPSASMDAIIGDENFTGANQPTVNVAAACKSLTIGTGSKVSTLTISSSALTVSGGVTIGANGTISHTSNGILSLTGDWNNSGSYNGTVNGAPVTFAGSAQALTGSTTFKKVTINSGATVTQTSGTVGIYDFIVSAGGTYQQQDGTVQIGHDWKNSGSFNATGGTIEFIGSGGGGATFATGSNQFYHVVVDAGVNPGFSADAGSAFSVAGDFTNNNSALANTTNLTTTFNGSGDQTVTSASTGATFGDVVLAKPNGSLVMGSNLSVAGSWTNNGGSLSGGSSTLTFTGASRTIGGTESSGFPNLVIAAGASYTLNTDASAGSLTMAVSGTANSLTHGNGINLAVDSVTINQPTASVVAAWNINAGSATVSGNLTIGSTTTSTGRVARVAITTGSLTVLGDLVFNSAASTAVTAQVVMSGGAGVLYLSGALSLGNGSGTLTPGTTSTVVYQGSGDQAVTSGSAISYNHLKIDKPSGTATLSAATSVNDLILQRGMLSAGVSNFALDVAGNWTNNDSYAGGSSTVTLTGSGKTIEGTSATDFPNLAIAAGASYTMNTSNTAGSLSFTAGNAASSLTHAAGTSFGVSGAVTVNHPTTTAVHAWNINAATATVGGLISFPANENSAGRVARIVVTTGILNANGGITLSGTGTAAASRVIDLSGGAGIVNLKGALTLSANGTLTAGTAGSIFNYADAVAQTVRFFSSGGYHNLHLNNTDPSGAALAAAITTSNVTGDLRVQSGTFSNGGFAIAGNAGKTLEVSNGATLTVAGTTSAFPTGFGTVSLGTTSTVEYSGTGAQTVAAQNYGHLTVSGSRGASNVTLASSGMIGVAGSFTASASFSGSNGYVTTQSTVDYNGSVAQSVTALTPLVSGSSGYDHLTISNSAQPVAANTSFSVAGNLTVGSGAILAPASGVVLSGSGTLTGSGTARVSRATGTSDFSGQYGLTRSIAMLTVEYAGSATQGINANTFGGLKINNSSGVTLSADITVNGTLTLTSGTITANGNTVIVSATGAVSRTSGHVVGKLQKQVPTGSPTRTFEIGDGSSYTPVTVAFASVTGAGNLVASTTAGDHPNINGSALNPARSVNRFWTLTNSGIGFTSYGITFSFLGGDLDAGTNTAGLRVSGYSSGTWTLAAAGVRTATTTEATGLTGFSDYQVAEYAAPSLALGHEVSPQGTQPPGTDLAYAVTITNGGLSAAHSLVLVDSLPLQTDFKLGSVTSDLGQSGLTVEVAYSSDGGTSWSYTPVSGAGGAPAGYDRNVTHIRWTFTGTLSHSGPGNTGSVGLVVRIR